MFVFVLLYPYKYDRVLTPSRLPKFLTENCYFGNLIYLTFSSFSVWEQFQGSVLRLIYLLFGRL